MADYISDAARRKQTGAMGALGTDPAAPGPSPLEIALMMAGGPMGRAMSAAPRAVGLGMGLLGGMGGLNEAEAQAKKGASATVTQADRDAASVLPPALQPQYIDLVSRARTGSLPRADRETLQQLNGIIATAAKGGNEAEQKRMAEAGTRAEEARQRALRDAPKTFAERFGDAASYMPVAPLLAGMATMVGPAAMGARAASRTAGEWRAAANAGLKATDAPTMANSAALANAYEKQFPKPTVGNTLGGYGVPMAIGGIEGLGVSNLQDAWNASLPPENPERKAYEAYLKELPPNHPDRERAQRIYDSLPQSNPVRDASIAYFSDPSKLVPKSMVGMAEGAAGGAFAQTLGKWLAPSEKGLPRAQTSALNARMAGSSLDDAMRAMSAEGAAMGNVLPLPPARPQLPPVSMPERALPAPTPRPTPGPAVAPPSAGYDPLAIQSQKLNSPAGIAVGTAGAGLLGAMSNGGQANAEGMPDIETLVRLVQSGQLPPDVLRELLTSQ